MTYRIFFSHSTKDQPWVFWMAEQMRAEGVESYLYEHDRQPGLPIPPKIMAKIKSCDSMVVFLTKNSENSAYVHQEIGVAKHAGKLVIPLVELGVKNLGMLHNVEYLFFNYLNPQASMVSLLSFLKKLMHNKAQGEWVLFGLGGLILLALTSNDEPPDRKKRAKKRPMN